MTIVGECTGSGHSHTSFTVGGFGFHGSTWSGEAHVRPRMPVWFVRRFEAIEPRTARGAVV